MQILKKAIVFILLFVVVIIGILFVINTAAFDEELNTELVALMEKPVRNVPEQENAYFFLMGFDAEENNCAKV